MKKIKFNKNFYKTEVVKEAAEDYKDAADVIVKEEEEFIIAEITPKEEINNIEGEFGNMLLD